MSKDFIGYDQLVDRSLRGVVRDALKKVSEQGLVGNHHMYLTFRTDYPGVEIPQYLRERYPDELTIVLQHQFWSLDVGEDSFGVSLSFNKMREHIRVPWAALTRFADPGVKFGLQFEPTPADGQPVTRTALPSTETEAGDEASPESPEVAAEAQDDAEKVVALDTFRKKS